jgi:purine-binding chemotaxis protein CheW
MSAQAGPDDALTSAALDLLLRRAERLRAKEGTAQEESVVWVAEFSIGEEQYSIPLNLLRAAVPLKMVTPVPLSAPHIIGVLRFQGKVISALSLASLLGGRAWRQDPVVLLVIELSWGQMVALDCEQIPRPTAIPAVLVESAKGRNSGPVLEITMRDKRLLNLIDLARLLDRRKENRGGH